VTLKNTYYSQIINSTYNIDKYTKEELK